MARGFEHISRSTRASVPGQVWSTSCFGRLALCSEARGLNQLSWATRAVPKVWQGRAAGPGDIGPGLWAPGVDQLPRDTRAWVGAPTGSTSSPGRLTIWSVGPWCRPPLPGDSGLVSTARVLDKVSQATRARVRLPVVSTSSPGRLGSGSEGRPVRPAIQGDSPEAGVRGPSG